MNLLPSGSMNAPDQTSAIKFDTTTYRHRLRRCFSQMLWLVMILISAAGGSFSAAEDSKPIAVGDKAPEFELAIYGQDSFLNLSSLVEDGPVVVVVLRGYPGYQCPICSRQVGDMINRAKTLSAALGDLPGRVVLVYPGEESGDKLDRRAKEFVGSRKIPDPLIVALDPNMEMVRSWGLRWDKPRETAYPAAYLIGANGRVKWAKVSKSHGDRASVEDILSAIKNL